MSERLRSDAGRETAPRILVVEDEGSLADSLRYNLEREGFTVSVAADGQTALARFREEQPSVLDFHHALCARDGVFQPISPLPVEEDVLQAPYDQRRHLERLQCTVHCNRMAVVKAEPVARARAAAPARPPARKAAPARREAAREEPAAAASVEAAPEPAPKAEPAPSAPLVEERSRVKLVDGQGRARLLE